MNTLLFHESPWIFIYLTISFGIIDNVLIHNNRNNKRYIIVSMYLLCIMIIIYLYRVPFRVNNYPPNFMVSPCDGKVISVLKINEITTHVAIHISLFFDSHIQWCPVDGVVKSSQHKQGTFNPTYMFNKSRYNERIETIVYVPQIHDEIKIVQIAGQLARRIVNYKDKQYDTCVRGELMGMIKFGSRVDLFVPHDKVRLLLNKGDVIFGNKTIIAKI